MQWFNGKLYVGTGRSRRLCRACNAGVSTSRRANRYVVNPEPNVTCPVEPRTTSICGQRSGGRSGSADPALPWKRLFQSEVVPIPDSIAPGKFMARDTAFRGMVVARLNGGPSQLYVAGVVGTEWIPGLPAPRILRMKDDETFEQIGGDPGTIHIGWDPKPVWEPTSFRAMVDITASCSSRWRRA